MKSAVSPSRRDNPCADELCLLYFLYLSDRPPRYKKFRPKSDRLLGIYVTSKVKQ